MKGIPNLSPERLPAEQQAGAPPKAMRGDVALHLDRDNQNGVHD